MRDNTAEFCLKACTFVSSTGLRRQRELVAGGEFGGLLRVEACSRTPVCAYGQG